MVSKLVFLSFQSEACLTENVQVVHHWIDHLRQQECVR